MNKKASSYIKIIVSIFIASAISLLIINTKSTFSYDENYNNVINEESDDSGWEINPDWIEYNKLSDEEKSKVEVIPEKYIYYFDENIHYETYKDPLPRQFDLRNVNGKSYVTPVKNQRSLGLCWAFSGIASIESYLLKSGLENTGNPLIFNERAIDYSRAMAVDNIPCNSTTNNPITVYSEGYNPMSVSGGTHLGSGGGPANVFKNAMYGYLLQPMTNSGIWSNYFIDHPELSIYDVFNNKDYVVTEYYEYPSLNDNSTEETKEKYYNMLKQHIMEYGALSVSTYTPDGRSTSCFVYRNNTNDGYDLLHVNDDCLILAPDNKKASGLHATAIVGWNDDYEQSYCGLYNSGTTITDLSKEQCEAQGGTYHVVKGAWILKNSWGTNSNYTGYLNLSYDSSKYNSSGVIKIIKKDFDKFYSSKAQDGTTVNYIEKNYSDRTSKITFKKGHNREMLKRLLFVYQNSNATNFDVFLKVPNQEDILLGQIEANIKGLYSIDTNNIVLKNDEFSIVFKNKTNNNSVYDIIVFTTVDDSIINKNVSLISSMEYDREIFENITKTSLLINMTTNNFNNGEKVIFKLYNEHNQDVSDKFVDFYGYSVLNTIYRIFEIPERIAPGRYKLVATLENGTILATEYMQLGVPITSNSVYIMINPNNYYIGSWDNNIVQVYDQKLNLLTLNVDYILTNNNYNAGTHTFTITGIGKYKDSVDRTYTINPKELTIKVKNKTIKYNEILSNITLDDITLNGLVNGESPNISGNYITNYAPGSSVGTYDLNANVNLLDNGNFRSSNYEIKNISGGKLTVEKALLEYNIPTGITASKNQVLSEVNLPDGFEWMNPSTVVTNSGNYKARAFKASNRNNYEEIENINIYITVLNNEDNFDYIINEYVEDKANNYIMNIPVGTNLETFKSKIILGDNYSVIADTKTVNGKKLLYTGGKTKIYKSNTLYKEFINIVKGDVTGSGEIKIVDVSKLYQFLRNKINIEKYYEIAGNVVSTDNVIKINDVAKLYQFVKGRINEL